MSQKVNEYQLGILLAMAEEGSIPFEKMCNWDQRPLRGLYDRDFWVFGKEWEGRLTQFGALYIQGEIKLRMHPKPVMFKGIQKVREKVKPRRKRIHRVIQVGRLKRSA